MARLDWKGALVSAKVHEATAVAVDATMAECVQDAKENHPEFPPASEPYERYANRTGFETGAVRILDNANGIAGSAREGDVIVGRWGAMTNYSLFLEIGTSRAGPTATEREDAAAGNMDLIAPPIGPLMAPRPFLRPAADRYYPELALKIGATFRTMR